MICIMKCKAVEDNAEGYADGYAEDLRVVGRLCIAKYFSMKYTDATVPRPMHVHIEINAFSESNCWVFFSFRREDLHRLKELLRIPSHVTFANGSTMSGEEAFLRFLYYLVSGEDHHSIAENVFGRDHTQQSRAWTYMMYFIYRPWGSLLQTRLQWFEAYYNLVMPPNILHCYITGENLN
jgi:hypothetical protein